MKEAVALPKRSSLVHVGVYQGMFTFKSKFLAELDEKTFEDVQQIGNSKILTGAKILSKVSNNDVLKALLS